MPGYCRTGECVSKCFRLARIDTYTFRWVCVECNKPRAVWYEDDDRRRAALESTNNKEKSVMSTTTIADLAAAITEALAPFLADNTDAAPKAAAKPAARAAAKKATAKAAAVQDDDADDEVSEQEAELRAMTIGALRKAALAAGFDRAEVIGADKELLVTSLLDVEADDAADDDDADDEEEVEETEEDEADEDEEGAWTADDLEGVTGLREMQRIAREDFGWKPAQYKGIDIDALRDALVEALGEDEDAEEDEDESADEITLDDIKGMSRAELVELAKENEIKIKPGTTVPGIRKAVIAGLGL